MYRSIGINRTGVTTICQIRSDVPDEIKGVEWLCYGSTTFSAFIPFYTNVPRLPRYVSKTGLDVSTADFFWGSRLIGTLADTCFSDCVQHIERYHEKTLTKGRRILLEYDKRMKETGDFSLAQEANEKLCKMAEEETAFTLNKVMEEASRNMKNGFKLSDN